jgi:hypothetical protein
MLTVERYQDLVRAGEKLAALEEAGVDNWEGYDIAMRQFYEDEDGEL